MGVTHSTAANFGHQPDPCPKCGKRTVNVTTPPAEWAGRTDVPTDPIYSCRSCHWTTTNRRGGAT